MPTLRTPESNVKFKEYVKNLPADRVCPLCEKVTLEKFEYWRIINNDFPYDQIAETHHMVVPIRHVSFGELDDAESKELEEIKSGFINENYDYIIEATLKNKSVPAHFHLHLIVAKT